MKRQITQENIQAVAQKIAKKFKPDKIILFGSYAWGKPGPDSDVDLFVVKKTDNTRELSRKISRSIFPRPFPLDLIVYTPDILERRKNLGDFFIIEILNKGKLLHG